MRTEHLKVLRALGKNTHASIDSQYHVRGGTTSTKLVRPETVREMIDLGWLVKHIGRAACGSAITTFRITAMGLGALVDYNEKYQVNSKSAARRQPRSISREILTEARAEVLMIMCSAPDVVLLPNCTFRNAQRVEGIYRESIPNTMRVGMSEDGLIERLAGGHRIPLYRISIKGLERLAERLHRTNPRPGTCICGVTESKHRSAATPGHPYTDRNDVAILDFIHRKLKELNRVNESRTPVASAPSHAVAEGREAVFH